MHCCNGHSNINKKLEISTPCRIATPQNFIPKFSTQDYVGDITSRANSGGDRLGGRFSPNTWNITHLWLFWLSLFFSQSSPQVKLRLWCTRLIAQTTWFRARRFLSGVRIKGDAIWEKYAPTPPPKWAWKGNFKPNWRDHKITISQSH